MILVSGDRDRHGGRRDSHESLVRDYAAACPPGSAPPAAGAKAGFEP